MKGPIKILAITFTVCIMAFHSDAQNTTDSTKNSTGAAYTQAKSYTLHKPKGPKPIRHEFGVAAALNSNGWSALVDFGKVKSNNDKQSDMFYWVRVWQIEFSEVKDPKEYKNSNTEVSNYTGEKPAAYVLGKENDFYTLKIGYGFRKMIAGKPDPGTVSIHWVGIGGLSLGLLKPYYINAVVNNQEQAIKYSDSLRSYFLNQSDIVGSAGFSKGLSEIQFIPGLHAKTGLHFDFSGKRKLLLAVEPGVAAEVYTKPVPIMVSQKAVPYFVNVYLNVEIGKRW